MKQYLLKLSFVIAAYLPGNDTIAQTQLEPDQNPSFAVSRDKYMKIADSLNGWHSTTIQDRYRAIDWLADRKEARTGRRDFRRQLQLERARYSGYRHHPSYYYPRSSYYYNYRQPYRGHRANNPWRGFNFCWP